MKQTKCDQQPPPRHSGPFLCSSLDKFNGLFNVYTIVTFLMFSSLCFFRPPALLCDIFAARAETGRPFAVHTRVYAHTHTHTCTILNTSYSVPHTHKPVPIHNADFSFCPPPLQLSLAQHSNSRTLLFALFYPPPLVFD